MQGREDCGSGKKRRKPEKGKKTITVFVVNKGKTRKGRIDPTVVITNEGRSKERKNPIPRKVGSRPGEEKEDICCGTKESNRLKREKGGHKGFIT